MTDLGGDSTNDDAFLESGKRDLQGIAEDEKGKEKETNYSDRYVYDSVEEERIANIKSIEERNEDLRHSRKLRNKYANRGFLYLVCYSIFVGGLLLLSGLGCWGFSLGTGVLMVLVGSTAVSAIGLVYAVVSGLFAGLGKR